ncbi:MAG: GNAT family N-acetyltransferase [Microthrixaceae bacterium]|nr:GNAT family N-acetyltransferase [Microthrixaceae bacterium]
MQKVDRRLITDLVGREPRSTLALAAVLSADDPRDVKAVCAGRSSCVLARSSPTIWRGYPNLVDPAERPALAQAVERVSAVSLDGHPDDVEPLLAHMERIGEVARFPSIVSPADECRWDPSDPSTRVATPLDVGALDELYADYEIRFITGTRARRKYIQRCVTGHGAVVHDGPDGIDGAALTAGLTPQYLLLEHVRVAPGARGRGISWALVARVVEIALAYGVGVRVGSVSRENPMSLPDEQGWVETQASVNLRLRQRVPERDVYDAPLYGSLTALGSEPIDTPSRPDRATAGNANPRLGSDPRRWTANTSRSIFAQILGPVSSTLPPPPPPPPPLHQTLDVGAGFDLRCCVLHASAPISMPVGHSCSSPQLPADCQ